MKAAVSSIIATGSDCQVTARTEFSVRAYVNAELNDGFGYSLDAVFRSAIFRSVIYLKLLSP